MGKKLLIIILLSILIPLLVQCFDPQPLTKSIEPNQANEFLAIVAQISAGIFAVTFTIGALTITILSDRYSSELFALYYRDRLLQLAFLCGLFLVAVATISIGIALPMTQLGFLSITGLFTLTLLLISSSIYRSVTLLSPEKMAEFIGARALKFLHKKNEEKFDQYVRYLGDICIKAINNEEEKIAEDYLNAISNLQSQWIKHMLDDSTPLNLDDQMLGPLRISETSSANQQYLRIFRAAILENHESIVRSVVKMAIQNISYVIKHESTNSEKKKLILQGLLRKYEGFAAFAYEHQYTQRWILVREFRDIDIPPSQPPQQKWMYCEILGSSLVNIYRKVMQHEDEATFSLIVDWYWSGGTFIEDSYDELEHNLRLHHKMIQLISPRINRYSYELFFAIINSGESNSQDQSRIIHIYRTLDDILRWSIFLDAFLQVGAEAYVNKKYNLIKILWGKLTDPTASHHLPRHFGFTIVQLLDYLQNNIITDFDPTFHKKQEFYLLYLAYVLQHPGTRERDWVFPIIKLPKLEGEFEGIAENLIKFAHYRLNTAEEVFHDLAKRFENTIPNSLHFDEVYNPDPITALYNAHNWINDPNTWVKWNDLATQYVHEFPFLR